MQKPPADHHYLGLSRGHASVQPIAKRLLVRHQGSAPDSVCRAQDPNSDAVPLLPQQLTALTAFVRAALIDHEAAVTAPLPRLTQLTALRRLDLRLELHGTPDCNFVLPALLTGLTHLTIGACLAAPVSPGGGNQRLLGQVRP